MKPVPTSRSIERLRYGAAAELDLELPSERLVGVFQGPIDRAAGSVRRMVRAALDAPVDFPPLVQATVQNDQVVVALAPELTNAAEIVAGVVDHFDAAGASDRRLAILTLKRDDRVETRDPLALVDDRRRAVVVEHDPAERGELSYLANTASGRAIMLNRTICDADVLVSIGAAQSGLTWGNWGACAPIYPTFSDAETRRRFRRPGPRQVSRESVAHAGREVERVAWLLGNPFSVLLVPGASGRWIDAVAGPADGAFRRGQAFFDEAWARDVPRRAAAVIATLAGGSERQTWDNLGRAAATAARVVEDDGAIVLCTELESPPSDAIRRLGEARSVAACVRELAAERPADALAAAGLARALVKARVFLLSRLDEETVESLGLVHVDDPDDVVRLASRYSSCILAADADLAQIVVDEPSADG